MVWSNGTQIDFAGSDSKRYSTPPVTTPFARHRHYRASMIRRLRLYPFGERLKNGTGDEVGVLQFDGQSNVKSSYRISSTGGNPAKLTATGTYTVASNCLASATLTGL